MEILPLLVMFGVFGVLMVLSVPISFAIGVSSLATLMMMFPLHQALVVTGQKTASGFDSFTILSLPFFILASAVMNSGGIARRLINLAKVIGSPLPGSLLHTTILGNMMFGALSGSAVASAAAVGGVMAPEMKKAGYDPSLGAAANIASCTTGLLIPPSGAFIIYSLIAGGVSVSALFLAGYLPGLLLGLVMMAVMSYAAMKRGYRSQGWPALAAMRTAFVEAILPLGMVVLVMGGMVIGTFMDLTPGLLIFTPIFLPIVQDLGMDPVHFGVVMTLNLCVGIVTPPVGSALFVGASVAHVSLRSVMAPLNIYYVAFLIVLTLVTVFPGISLFLPRVVLGYGG